MKNLHTLFTGQTHLHLPECPSTNDYASDLLAEIQPAEGTVITARSQTAGRGQVGRGWESAPGQNLTMSVILYPKFLSAARQFDLNIAVSLAVFAVVEQYAADVTVKWPNDIYVGNKKIAGILIRNTVSGQNLQSAVVGIGLNVNQKIFLSNAPNPTSLLTETGKKSEPLHLCADICTFLEKYYLQLKSGYAADLRRLYLQHLYRVGHPFTFQRTADASYFTGIITRVTSAGKIVIDTETGLETFSLKEVRFCP